MAVASHSIEMLEQELDILQISSRAPILVSKAASFSSEAYVGQPLLSYIFKIRERSEDSWLILKILLDGGPA